MAPAHCTPMVTKASVTSLPSPTSLKFIQNPKSHTGYLHNFPLQWPYSSSQTLTQLLYPHLFNQDLHNWVKQEEEEGKTPGDKPLPALLSTYFTSPLSPPGDFLEICTEECVSTGVHLRNNQLKQLYSNSINVFKSTSYFPTGNPAKHTLQQTLK